MLRAVALAGATGTGKSALALEIAERRGCAVVSCDSMQVYRGLDIGTAKPTPEERARVPHHMIDCVGLPEIFSAAAWADGAATAIREENARGRAPLVTGGTGLYLRALLGGLAPIPSVPEALREALAAEAARIGTPAMHARLREVDPQSAARLNEGDTQRVLRALSVFEASGVPLSDWQRRRAEGPRIDCPVFVLEVAREPLRRRLAERFRAMMAAGWLDEVRWLASLDLPDTHPAMRAVGYRQLLAHVRGECELEAAVRDGMTATRRYAKRQVTWFGNQCPDAERGGAESLAPRVEFALTRAEEALA